MAYFEEWRNCPLRVLKKFIVRRVGKIQSCDRQLQDLQDCYKKPIRREIKSKNEIDSLIWRVLGNDTEDM